MAHFFYFTAFNARAHEMKINIPIQSHDHHQFQASIQCLRLYQQRLIRLHYIGKEV